MASKVITTGRQFYAKFFGKCAACGVTIRKGGLITMATLANGKRQAIHWDCAPEHGTQRPHVRDYYSLANGNGVASLEFDPSDLNALRGREEHEAHEAGASYDDNAERYAGEFGTCGHCGARTIDAGGHCEGRYELGPDYFAAAKRCADCGERDAVAGHYGCQYPGAANRPNRVKARAWERARYSN